MITINNNVKHEVTKCYAGTFISVELRRLEIFTTSRLVGLLGFKKKKKKEVKMT